MVTRLTIRRHDATTGVSDAWKGNARPTLYSIPGDPDEGCHHCGEQVPVRIYAFSALDLMDLADHPDERAGEESYCSIHCLGQRWAG